MGTSDDATLVPLFPDAVIVRARAQTIQAGIPMPTMTDRDRRMLELGIEIGIAAAQSEQLIEHEEFLR